MACQVPTSLSHKSFFSFSGGLICVYNAGLQFALRPELASGPAAVFRAINPPEPRSTASRGHHGAITPPVSEPSHWVSVLWQQQDKRDAARELLAPIDAWCSEGFDAADFQEAKALLPAWL
jgi:hypothetical protein